MPVHFYTKLAVVTALLCWIPSTSLAQRSSEPTKNNPKVLEAFRGVVGKLNGSVVRVVAGGKEVSLGTIVGADGWILTKNSQLKEDVKIKLPGGEEVPAKVIGVKDDCDLALLRIAAKSLPVVEWKPSKSTAPGDWVIAAGTDKDPIAVGVVSVATRTMGRRDYPPATNPNSGFLGINLSEDTVDKGVKIGAVQENTAASKAGLKVGDVILTIEGKPMNDPESVINTIAQYKPKDEITVKIKREGEEQSLKVTLGTRPRDLSRGDFQNWLGNEMSERRSGFPAILQHDTILKPIDCGGPLVDLDGKVVGINIARAGRVETYAIPSENVLALLDELKSGKLAPAPVKKPDPTKTADLEKLEKAVQSAQDKHDVAVKKSEAVAKLLKTTEEAATQFGKDNPDLVEARERVKKLSLAAAKEITESKAALEKAKAEFDKAKQ